MTAIDNGTRLHSGAPEAVLDTAHDQFANLVADAEALLNTTADAVGSQAASARARLQRTLSQAKQSVRDGLDAAASQGRGAARATDNFVHDRPWPVIGTVAVAAVAIGFLLGRR